MWVKNICYCYILFSRNILICTMEAAEIPLQLFLSWLYLH